MTSSFVVKLRIYDLSRGMVKAWSPFLIGKQIDGVWHTAVEVYGMEYFYGGGILCLGSSEFDRYYDLKPVEVLNMGTTEVDQSCFHDFLNSIQPDFTAEKYNLISWNCNNFTNEICNFLLGKNIPQYILNTPYDVMSTPKGKLILDMMQSCQTSIAPGFGTNSTVVDNNMSNNSTSTGVTSGTSGNTKNTHNNGTNNTSQQDINDYSKVPSVSLHNFFDENKVKNVLTEYINNNNYKIDERKEFINILISFFENLIINPNILKNRLLYKKSYNNILNNLSTSSEYNIMLCSIGFLLGFIENDEINNSNNITVFVDSKYNQVHSFSEHFNLFVNKYIFLKNSDSSINKIDVLHFKDISEYSSLIEKSKINDNNEVFIFLSENFLNNNLDTTTKQNDFNYFNSIKN
uniref:palmitoyl-protein hydrolase n=1 Tax=Piliocolobus tephrosceles TaxID=591936 RepID=A0A8C9LH36_9PRIM